MTTMGLEWLKHREQQRHNLKDESLKKYDVDVRAATADKDRSSRENIASLDRTSREGIATLDRSSRENIASLDRTSRENIASLDRRSREAIASADRQSRENIASADRSSRESIASADRTSRETIADKQIASQQTIAALDRDLRDSIATAERELERWKTKENNQARRDLEEFKAWWDGIPDLEKLNYIGIDGKLHFSSTDSIPGNIQSIITRLPSQIGGILSGVLPILSQIGG